MIRFVPVELAGPLGAWLSPTHGASPSPSPKDHPNGSPKSSLSSPKRRAFLEPDTAQVHILQAPKRALRFSPQQDTPLEDTPEERFTKSFWEEFGEFCSGGVGGKSGVYLPGYVGKIMDFFEKKMKGYYC